ncbi:MAG: hypothetical protein IJW51_04465 [Clostridia bacterium]|nr:hypothetical protein [Clostridia bacterium]
MKILIAYASKTGNAREMCELLASLLTRHEVTLADLASTPNISPAAFDHVVLGGSVRMGKLHRPLRAYLKAEGEALVAVPHTLFLCCAFADQFENYAEMLYPKALLESADEVVYFGGELNTAKQRGLDKLLVRMMRNSILESEDDEAMLPGLLPEHVRLLSDRLSGR